MHSGADGRDCLFVLSGVDDVAPMAPLKRRVGVAW